jgi:asparaginyl-tRNA synthetase
LTTGCSLEVSGELVKSPGKGQSYEVQAIDIKVFGDASPDSYPLQKKEMSLDFLRDIAHLRARTSLFSSVFRLRSAISHMVHNFFLEKDFYYVHTPILTLSDAEGAGEAFKVTNFDFNKIPRNQKGDVEFKKDFFEDESMLCVTGQLEAELLAMGLGKVYTFGPTFRAENSNTSRHLAEFWMIEPEAAFHDMSDIILVSQEMIKYLTKKVLEGFSDEIEVITKKSERNPLEYLPLTLDKDFARISYTEAIELLKGAKKDFQYPVAWGSDLKNEHEKFLCEEYFSAPTVVYNYPEKLKPFYMYSNEDKKTVRAFDILVPGIGELIGGSQREDREDILLTKLRSRNISEESLQWYIDSRRFGTVPHSGYGLGFERLLMWFTGLSNIRDVIPFPRTPGNCKF